MNGVDPSEILGKAKSMSNDNSFWSKVQDASHLSGNSTYKGARWKAGAMSTAFSAVAGAGVGGVIGGIGGAVSDDSTFFSGAAKGAAIGAGALATVNLGGIAYGRHLGKQDYVYKTSMYTNAGIKQGAIAPAGTVFDL